MGCLAAISVMVAVSAGCGGIARHSAGPAQAASAGTGGEACVFSAPSVGFGLAGHVAWGFEVASGAWEFGGNEGPSFWPPRKIDISKTWDETGSFRAMLAAFAKGGPYEGTRFYTSYKCETVPAPDAARAANEVRHESHQYYAIPGRDCLSQVYNVLSAYGAAGLPDDIGVFGFVPNTWYKHLSGFSAPHRL